MSQSVPESREVAKDLDSQVERQPSSSQPVDLRQPQQASTQSPVSIGRSLHLLIIEDSEDDAILIVRELQRSGYRPIYQRVDNRENLNIALNASYWDLVIADYNLPNFDALSALDVLHEKSLDLPFIIVSGSIGEDTAVAAMKAGAHDYLMKNNLARLVPAVERELREAQERQKRRDAEQALRDSEKRFRSLIENALDIITVLDATGTIRYVSPSIERVLGHQPITLMGKVAFDYVHIDDVDSLLTAFNAAIQTPDLAVAAEFRFLHQDGSWRVLEAVGKQYVEPDGTGRLVINARDITERKQAEETQKALEKEKELNELKSRFVSMMSHEFRTPLSVVVLSARLLERFHQVAPEEKMLLYLDRIQGAAKRMTQLLDEVLFLGRTELGKQEFKPKPLDLVPFCQELIEELQLTISSSHTISFTCEQSSISACMDDVLLRHILMNLITNAVKYSPDNLSIQFDLTCQTGTVTFQIKDRGIGIPEADLERLFESFQRGSNVGKIPGTGLGLAIVHQSVQLHRGEITVNSQVNQGTTFSVFLPRYSTPVQGLEARG